MEIIKTCIKCNYTGNIDNFVKKRNLCKKCKSIEDKEYRQKNKEKLANYFHDKWINDENRRIKNKNIKSYSRNGVPYNYVDDKYCEICGMSNKEHIKNIIES